MFQEADHHVLRYAARSLIEARLRHKLCSLKQIIHETFLYPCPFDITGFASSEIQVVGVEIDTGHYLHYSFFPPF